MPWVASNLDRTVPTADGIAPGNGALVGAVESVVGHGPDVVAGKPYPPLFDETVRRTGATRPLVVGDRLDTDIEGANRCDADSLLVMTGVTDVEALCRAQPVRRPSYVAWTLRGLLGPHQAPTRDARSWVLGDWSASAAHGALSVESTGPDRDVGLRVVAVTAWDWYDNLSAAEGHDGSELDVTAAVDALRLT